MAIRYIQNRGVEHYLIRDSHDRWLIPQPSAKKSVDEFVRWVGFPEDEPTKIARTALRQPIAVGYNSVRQSDAPDPVQTTMTAMFVSEPWPDATHECRSCVKVFASPKTDTPHCWEAHPWMPNPEQVRLRQPAVE